MVHIGSKYEIDTFACVDYYINEYLYAGGLNVFYSRELEEGRLTGARCASCRALLNKIVLGRRGSPKASCYLQCPPED